MKRCENDLCRRGSVSVEMMAVAVALLAPFLLALSQLARLDRSSRELQYAAQASCMAAAFAGNEDPSFRLISVERRVQVSMRPEIVRLMGGTGGKSLTLKRCYWIATGSGYEGD
ncbi:MAG: hypothetical protein R6X19_06115 [Kiritimatiellia bacterium]